MATSPWTADVVVETGTAVPNTTKEYILRDLNEDEVARVGGGTYGEEYLDESKPK